MSLKSSCKTESFIAQKPYLCLEVEKPGGLQRNERRIFKKLSGPVEKEDGD